MEEERFDLLNEGRSSLSCGLKMVARSSVECGDLEPEGFQVGSRGLWLHGRAERLKSGCEALHPGWCPSQEELG